MNIIEDVWHKLQKTDKPIVVYGMGDGADKIINVFDRYGIEVSDFFASDGFVRGQIFHTKTVLSFSQIKEKYGDFVIVVAFATSLPDVMERIYRLADEYELYAPDVPVAGDELFNSRFYAENEDKLNRVRELLADGKSKLLFDNIINYKLSGDISYLKCDYEESLETVFNPEHYRSYADLGAYTGDTIKKLMDYSPLLSEIYAFEPDVRNYKKLSEYLEGIEGARSYNIGAWSGKGELPFDTRGGRNSRLGTGKSKSRLVEVNSLDNILEGRRVDYIKYDVEGAEYEALKGSEKTILQYTPDLSVSVYHRSEDIFRLPLMLNELCGKYSFYLSRSPYIPAWDLRLNAKLKAGIS